MPDIARRAARWRGAVRYLKLGLLIMLVLPFFGCALLVRGLGVVRGGGPLAPRGIVGGSVGRVAKPVGSYVVAESSAIRNASPLLRAGRPMPHTAARVYAANGAFSGIVEVRGRTAIYYDHTGRQAAYSEQRGHGGGPWIDHFDAMRNSIGYSRWSARGRIDHYDVKNQTIGYDVVQGNFVWHYDANGGYIGYSILAGIPKVQTATLLGPVALPLAGGGVDNKNPADAREKMLRRSPEAAVSPLSRASLSAAEELHALALACRDRDSGACPEVPLAHGRFQLALARELQAESKGK